MKRILLFSFLLFSFSGIVSAAPMMGARAWSTHVDTWMWVICVLAALALLVVTWRDWLIRKQRKRYDDKVRDLVRTLYGIRLPLASIKAPLEELAGQGSLSDEERSRICTALRHTDSLLELVENLKKEWQMNVWSDEDGIVDDELNARLEEIMEFFRLYADEAQGKNSLSPSGCTNCNNELDWKFIASVQKAVEDNMDTPGFTVDTLCGMLNMSRTSFYNKLKALTDQAPADYVRLIRLNRAKQLLREQRYTVTEVAGMTGFSDAAYFREVFKKHFHISPTQYAKGEEPNPASK